MNEREPHFRRYLAITVTGLTVSVHVNLLRDADAKGRRETGCECDNHKLSLVIARLNLWARAGVIGPSDSYHGQFRFGAEALRPI